MLNNAFRIKHPACMSYKQTRESLFLESISSVRWKGRISLSNDLSWDTDSEREMEM